MKGDAKEYILDQAAPAPPLDRRQKMRRYRQRVNEMRAAGRISRGEYDYISRFIEIANELGNGDTVRLGVRELGQKALCNKNTAVRYHRKLIRAGLMTFRKDCWYVKGWHSVSEYGLNHEESSVPILGTDSVPKPGTDSVPKMGTSFTVKGTEVSKRLYATREALLNRAAPQTESKKGESSSSAGGNGPTGRQEATKGGSGSSSHKAQSDASKVALSKNRRRNRLIGLLKDVVGKEAFEKDQNKWAAAAGNEPDRFETFISSLRDRLKTGTKVKTTMPQFMAYVWKQVD